MEATWDEHDPLEALAGGDPGPFEAFVAREVRGIHGFFRHLGAGSEEAEDLAQELFVRLFRCSPRYTPEGRFRAFAFRVARNVWIDRQRSRPELAASEEGLEEVPDRAAAVETELATREEAERAAAAVAELSEPHRFAFELGVVRGLPYEEVAEALEIPVGTVKSRVHHAVRKLRAALARGRATEARA